MNTMHDTPIPGLICAGDVADELLDPATQAKPRAIESGFRRGAHHAVTRLTEALESVRSIGKTRDLADAFADVIGEMRHRRDEHFDLYTLIARATARVRGAPKPSGAQP
jgi:hypothetical protein